MLLRGWDRRTIVLLTFAFLSVIAGNLAQAQVFDLERDRVQMAELHGFWRFHTGDDPDGKLGWAQPGFDDSSWRLGRSDQFLDSQSCPGYSGTAWYRFRVVVPADHPPLALYATEIGTSFQVFVDGRFIGQFGGLPPHERVFIGRSGWVRAESRILGQMMPIPADLADGKGSLVIAIRVWQWPDFASFCNPGFEAWSIGDASLVSDLRRQRWNYQFWSFSAQNVLLLGYLLAALAGLGLFLLRPGEREYLWFAAVGSLTAGSYAWGYYPVFHPIWLQSYTAMTGLWAFLSGVCGPIFFVTILKQPRGWTFWCTIGSAFFGSLMVIPFLMHWMTFPVWIAVIYLAWIPFMVFQFLLVFLPARRGKLDARLMLVPLGLQIGAFLGGELLFAIRAAGHGGSLIAFLAEKWDRLFEWPFPISVPNVADFLWQISLLAILILRFAPFTARRGTLQR